MKDEEFKQFMLSKASTVWPGYKPTATKQSKPTKEMAAPKKSIKAPRTIQSIIQAPQKEFDTIKMISAEDLVEKLRTEREMDKVDAQFAGLVVGKKRKFNYTLETDPTELGIAK